MTVEQDFPVTWVPIGDVKPYPGNPRKISKAAVNKVAASLREFGWRQPIVVDPDNVIVVGHTRLKAAKSLKYKRVLVHVARGLTEAQVRAYRLADNRTHEEAEWDMPALEVELKALDALDFDLTLSGFDPTEYSGFLEDGSSIDGADDVRGTLLSRVNITIDEPKHKVAKGDHYEMAGRHHLFCCSVLTDWPTWAPLLLDGAIFCPYPGPFAAFGEMVAKHPLVMVQPEPYTAGHILDRFAEIHGADSIRKVSP